MSEVRKRKRLKVEGENGEIFYFNFKPLSNVGEDEVVCETRCSYGDICDKIRDPRALSDPESSFQDFCGELGELDNPEDCNIIPVPGTLEEGFREHKDIFSTLVEKNPTIRINDVIESICSTGWCGDYSEDHCNCLSSNKSCLLHDLFLKPEKGE